MNNFITYSLLQIKLEWSSQWGKIGKAGNMHGSKRNVYRVLVGKPEGKTPLRRSRLYLENNIEMDIREKARGVKEWVHLTQDMDRWRSPEKTVTMFQLHVTC
jgi:hypothetical protein